MEGLRKKRVVWTDTAVNVMLNVFEEKKILEHLDGSRYRNADIFKIVASEINNQLISEYTVDEVRIKWKSLKKSYKDMKIKNGTSGHNKVTFKFYDRLCELFDHRAMSKPMVNGVDSSSTSNNSCLKIEEPTKIEEDESIIVSLNPFSNNDNIEENIVTYDKPSSEQAGKIPRARTAPSRNAPYKKSLKSFSKDVAEEAKKLQAEFFIEQEKLMNTFFIKQKNWEEEVMAKEEARSLADRISNENIMKNLMNCINNQSAMQYPHCHKP